MPSYNTNTVANALGVTPKWLDNLLSHNDLDDLRRDSQGASRRLSLEAVTQLSLAKDLIDSTGIKAPAALNLAGKILKAPAGELIVSPGLRIRLDTETIRTAVLDALARAVEIAPTPRRGRPPKR